VQTLVAKDLGMERGKCSSIVEAKKIGVEVQESRKRINIKEYKIQKRKEKELEKELEKEKNKNIKLEKELYNFREMQKTITALELTSDEKKELHRLNSQVKNQNATIEELNKKIEELTVTNSYRLDKLVLKQKEINDLKALTNNEEVNILKTQNKSLEEQNKTLESKVITLEDKINSSANMSDYETIKKENESLKNENTSLKQKLKDIVNLANEKIKSLFQFKIWNNYRHKQTKFDLEYINETKQDFWEELAHYHPKIETLYSENIKNELIKIDDLIPGETINYSKMNLQDILNSNKEELEEFKKEATKELKELLEENKETVVHNTRKLF
jgi:DNA repair exonuclease SbcCD ATPase subunit